MTRQKLYNTAQTSRLLGISRDTLYRWMRAKKIKGGKLVHLGAKAQTQIRLWSEGDLKKVKAWMRENYIARKEKRGGRK